MYEKEIKATLDPNDPSVVLEFVGLTNMPELTRLQYVKALRIVTNWGITETFERVNAAIKKGDIVLTERR